MPKFEIRIRRNVPADVAPANGEPIVEQTDNGWALKVGDGTTVAGDLPVIAGPDAYTLMLDQAMTFATAQSEAWGEQIAEGTLTLAEASAAGVNTVQQTAAARSAGLTAQSATEAAAFAALADRRTGEFITASDRAQSAVDETLTEAQETAASVSADRSAAGEFATSAAGAASAAAASATAAGEARTGAETARTEAETARDLALAGQFLGENAASAPGRDLNAITTPGVYRFRAAAAIAASNLPVIKPGILEVFLNPEGALQRFTPWRVATPYSRGIYQRQADVTGATWTPWAFIPTQRIDTTAGLAVYTWDDVNNREVLIHGDTGWRDIGAHLGPDAYIDPATPGGSFIRIRRVGGIVYLAVRLRVLNEGGSLMKTFVQSLPVGFYPYPTYGSVGVLSLATGAVLSVDNTGTAAALRAGALGVSLKQGDVFAGQFSFMPAHPAWPTTLPGTPA